MPIGLSDDGPRACDVQARRLLGRARSSVFPAPLRGVLDCTDYADACAVSRRASGKALSVQAWNLVPAIRALDDALDDVPADRVREVHPELAFRALDDRVDAPKASARGLAQRIRALQPAMDVLDALAAGTRGGAGGRRARRLRRGLVGAAAGRRARRVRRRRRRRQPRPPDADLLVSAGWQEVADGILVRRHAELDLNCGLVLGDGACLVVDTRSHLGEAADLIAAVRAVTPHPVDGGEHPRPLRPLLRQRRVPAGGRSGARAAAPPALLATGGGAARRRRRRAGGGGRPPGGGADAGGAAGPARPLRRRDRRPRRRRPGGGAALPRPRAHRPRPGGGGGGRRGRDGGLRRRPRGAGRPTGVRGRLARGVAGDPRPAARPRPRTRRPRSWCGRRRGVRRHPARGAARRPRGAAGGPARRRPLSPGDHADRRRAAPIRSR